MVHRFLRRHHHEFTMIPYKAPTEMFLMRIQPAADICICIRICLKKAAAEPKDSSFSFLFLSL